MALINRFQLINQDIDGEYVRTYWALQTTGGVIVRSETVFSGGMPAATQLAMSMVFVPGARLVELVPDQWEIFTPGLSAPEPVTPLP